MDYMSLTYKQYSCGIRKCSSRPASIPNAKAK
jgi:hypothetical protein